MRWPWQRKTEPEGELRYSVNDYLQWVNSFTFNGTAYAPQGVTQTLAGDVEPAARGFAGMAQQAFGANAVAFAVLAVRQLVFSAVRFQYQAINGGRPSKMFGSQSLRLLEVPWDGGTTQDLLNRVIQDADLSGNFYGITDTPLTRLGGDGGAEVVRLRPDWVEAVLEPRVIRNGQVGYRRIGIIYTEGGPGKGGQAVAFGPGDFAHFAPHPDPLAYWRGMSWLTPVARELQADGQMTTHKQKYFENGATPNIIVTYPAGANREDMEKLAKVFGAKYEGVDNAYRTLHLGGGADATVVGNSMEQIDFSAVQGAGEVRIANAGGIPATVIGLSEGLKGSSLNAGNYSSARRRMADGTMHPLWQNAAGSLAPLVAGSMNAPTAQLRAGTARLWYDARDVPFLREDEKDSAAIAQTRANTIKTYIDAGFTPESATDAVMAEDEGLLVHTGLVSVQLQTPGATAPAAPADANPTAGTDPAPTSGGTTP
jgi:hypothetical protein